MILQKKMSAILGIFVLTSLLAISGCSTENRTVSPQIVGEWRLQGLESDVGVTAGITGEIGSGDYLFLAAGDNGPPVEAVLRILDLKDSANPIEVGHLKATDNDNNNFHYIMDMELSGTVIYILVDNYLWNVDVSDPTEPKDIIKLPTQYWLLQITISGDYAYISVAKNTNEVGIIVMDISDPALPKEVGISGLLLRGLNGFMASSSSLFVIAEDGLHIADISSPNSLEEIGFIPNSDGALEESQDPFQDIAIAGKYAYITSGESGLHVFDISNPSSPKEIASLDTKEKASSILISGNLVYVIDWRTMTSMEGNTTPILIIDISNPDQPKELASVELPVYSGNFHFAEANNHIYFLSNTDPFVRIVDVYAAERE